MIKDSKLIGTKIKAPFGWQQFKVGELFDVQSTKAVNYDELMPNGKYPYVVRSANNNGIREYMSGDLSMLNKGHCITLGIDTASYFYQDCDKFFAGVKVKALHLLNRELSENIALYLIECLSRYVTGYGYTGGKPFKVTDFLNEVLILPVTADDQPDFEWMSDYIKAVKSNYLEQKALSNRNEIEAYLSAGNVDSTDITDDDRQFLRNFAKLPRRKFKVTDILTLKNSPDIHVEQKTVPLVSAGDNNHGIKERIQTFEYCNNVLTVSKLGQTFYYHSNVCYTDDVLGLQLPVDSVLVGLFLQAILNKQTRQLSSYGHQFRMKRLSELSLTMPISNGDQIDVQSIEKYMQIQSKPLINNIVKTLVPVGEDDLN